MSGGRRMKMVDLCSGLGGASQPMVDNGWDVLRFDNNPLLSEVPYTRIFDILKMPDFEEAQWIDLIWASPPCVEFSLAYSSPKSKARRNGSPYEPNLELMLKCKEIIEQSNPRYWVIENVIGAIKDFTPYLGTPRQIIGPFVLWGNFPYIHLPPGFQHSKALNDKTSTHPLRSNWKALIPYPLADSLRIAVEEQQSILDWV